MDKDKKQDKISKHENETTREIQAFGKKIRVRRIPPSKEALRALGRKKRIDIIGHIAINPPEIEKEIRMQKATILREMAMMNQAERKDFINKGPIDFAGDKRRKKRYYIYCTRCQEKIAYVWAKNEKLEEWCDLHYLCSHDRETWYGALAINVSPIDGKIGIECACGEDTRDYRANRSMPPIQKQLMIEYSQKHRKFGDANSTFLAIPADRELGSSTITRGK